jgi:membrane-bound ClpP family serine protease
MQNYLSKLLDNLSEFLSTRKGLIPLIGVILIVFNLIIQFFPGDGILVKSNLFLHLGVITSILGFLLAKAL